MSGLFGNFPNRPDHPDFWRLSDVVLKLDGRSDEGGVTLEEAAQNVIDLPSLTYMAEQRCAKLAQAVGVSENSPAFMAMVTVFITSVITGIEFERTGGHQ